MRVPRSTQAPLTFPGMLSTAGHCDQSSASFLILFLSLSKNRGAQHAQSSSANSRALQSKQRNRKQSLSGRVSDCAKGGCNAFEAACWERSSNMTARNALIKEGPVVLAKYLEGNPKPGKCEIPGPDPIFMMGLGGLEPPTSPLSELRSLVPREEFTLAAFFCRSRHLLQGTILERLTMRSWIRALQAEGRESAGATGLERAASCVTEQRSNQLNYVPNRHNLDTSLEPL